ncbi:MAG TPA: amidophosphoribosyltransferase [Acidimicrobiales bacterium]|nr:amidophosphoribosyltransferase [Acidimicrobiales bacterium]
MNGPFETGTSLGPYASPSGSPSLNGLYSDDGPSLEDGSGTEHESPREACGVFGIYAMGRNVAPVVFDGLHALQHRGQESAGMAVTDGSDMIVVKDMGLVTQVFNEYKIAGLVGHLAIGHTRYSTTGSSSWHNAQPMYRQVSGDEFAVAHNGNLTNVAALAAESGMLPGTVTSDSDLMAELIARQLEQHQVDGAASGAGASLVDALVAVLPRLEGAFSLVLADRDELVGVRDPNGFRPLCLGKLDDGWVLASETPALDIAGAHFVREVEPGEVIAIGRNGCRSLRPWPASKIQPRLCLFEFVYLARPDSRLYGQELHGARVRMGELLAEQAPANADMVVGVPDSGVPAAEGYSRRSGIPFGHALVKNRYIGRTFINPDAGQRANNVRRKLNPLRDAITGKRLVVVDDSIVRGTTTRSMVAMFREAGVREVHLRISSPPYRWPCFYGLDTGTRAELVAADLEVGEICDYIGADSLAYLTLDALEKATGVQGAGFCNACLTGDYPVDIPVHFSKDMLEGGGDRLEGGGPAPHPSNAGRK